MRARITRKDIAMTSAHAGIDVSKAKFDLVVHENGLHQVFQMNPKEFKKCIQLLNEHEVALVVMEATGGYELELFLALADAELNVAVVNPRQARDFAKACGKLAKTDKIDAAVLAMMAAALEPKPTVRPDDTLLKIRAIAARRRQVITMLYAEKNRRKQAKERLVQRSLDQSIRFFEKQLQKIDAEMQNTIDQSPTLRDTAEILRSVPGLGPKATPQILADLPELGQLNRRQIASLVGLAPKNRDSGTMRGKRMTGGGRATVRKALYMPTLVATRHNSVITAYYQHLLEKGKTKMVALTACMRKLLVILNAMVANNEKWNPNYA
jgi:transposase